MAVATAEPGRATSSAPNPARSSGDDPNERFVAHRVMGGTLGQLQRFDEALHRLDVALALAEQVALAKTVKAIETS